jgi:hypothetical protein
MGVYIYGDWLPDMGFTPGVLVQALPEPDGGIVFRLCDENIRRYSELDAVTQKSGGKLIQAHSAVIKQKERPGLATSGQILCDAGFSFGDMLIARYQRGQIRLKKLPDTARVTYMKSVEYHKSGNPVLKLRLTGMWLSAFGFTPDALLTADIKSGLITFKLRDGSIETYSSLVRIARQNKMKLFQVRTAPVRDKQYPYIMLTGAHLDNAGFKEGEPLLVLCEYGIIKVQNLDFTDVDF